MCDANDYAVRAILGQRKDKKLVIIYYASKVVDSSQANYTITKKELSVVVFTLDKFWSYLIDSQIIVYTDHTAIKVPFE
jgi:exopolysaccharide biosynthesis protein